MRVRMPDGDDRVPAVQIQVLVALFVPEITSLGPYRLDVVKGINVEEIHFRREWALGTRLMRDRKEILMLKSHGLQS